VGHNEELLIVCLLLPKKRLELLDLRGPLELLLLEAVDHLLVRHLQSVFVVVPLRAFL